jgi:hypothetical protein
LLTTVGTNPLPSRQTLHGDVEPLLRMNSGQPRIGFSTTPCRVVDKPMWGCRDWSGLSRTVPGVAGFWGCRPPYVGVSSAVWLVKSASGLSRGCRPPCWSCWQSPVFVGTPMSGCRCRSGFPGVPTRVGRLPAPPPCPPPVFPSNLARLTPRPRLLLAGVGGRGGGAKNGGLVPSKSASTPRGYAGA